MIDLEQKRAQAKAMTVGVDGFPRSASADENINQICRNALSGATGEALMEYLKSITSSVVMPASATDAELRDREGMRRLVGILDQRRKSQPMDTPNE